MVKLQVFLFASFFTSEFPIPDLSNSLTIPGFPGWCERCNAVNTGHSQNAAGKKFCSRQTNYILIAKRQQT
jgi:hypothetical protein